MDKKMVLMVTMWALSISACDLKPKKATETINSPDPVLVDRQNKMQERLVEKTGLVYLKEYKQYRGDQKAYVPCDVNFRQELKLATTDALNIAHIALTHKNHFLYRDGALEFFRKANSSAESLQSIAASLEMFCLSDAKKIESCVGPAEQSLRVQINVGIAGHQTVHPSVRPSDVSNVYFYSVNDERRVRAKYVSDFKDIDFSPKTALEKNTTRAEIGKISACLQSVKVEYDIAKQIAKTFATATTQIAADCERMKADAEERGLELSKPIARFCE